MRLAVGGQANGCGQWAGVGEGGEEEDAAHPHGSQPAINTALRSSPPCASMRDEGEIVGFTITASQSIHLGVNRGGGGLRGVGRG